MSPRSPTFADQVRAQAVQTPDAVAVEGPAVRLDYATLEARSNQLAHLFLRRGVGRESLVAVTLAPSPDRVVAMLAIWKAGGAYLPIDARDPRSTGMLAECDVALTMTEDLFAEATGESAEPPPIVVEPGHLAYVLYTSGSTGRPKGVAVEHRGLAALHDAHVAAGSDGVHRVLAFAPPTFDASLSELALALTFGGTLCIPTTEPVADFIAKARIDCVILPPSVLATLPESLDLRVVISAGDVCPQAVVDRWAPGRLFFNHYGPTEASVWSTVARCQAGSRPTIGRAVAGVELRVLDEALAPAGEGELYIGGAGVARGYHRRPALTAQRFVPCDGGRWFKSGDRVRVLAGGELDFVGRIDRQVKVRGVRVDLLEVESALGEAAVVADGERLVAYVVASVPPAELRAALASKLPAAAMPTVFAYLDALPRTSSGKIDYAALPPPERAMWRRAYVAPDGPVESWLAERVAQTLGCARVGADEDFFELGGHSLAAGRLLARIAAERNLTVPLATFLAAPTVRSLARALTPAPPAPPSLEPPGPSRACSSAEERLLFVDALQPGLAVYNTPLLVELQGPTDVLVRAVQEVVRRHAVLRDRYRDDGGIMRAEAGPDEPLPVAVVEVREDELQRRVDADVRRPFDLRRGPLIRATLFRLGGERAALLLTLHHLVFDGWSSGVLVRELLEAPPPSSYQYRDWAAEEARWLASDAVTPLVDYWRKALSGARAPELPTDRAPPPLRSHPGVRIPIRFDPRKVRALAREERSTPFMVLLAAFQALLARHSGEDDLTVGTPVAGRAGPRTHGLIGCFVNTIALRTSLAGSPTFRELLLRAREVTRSALAHQELPFQRVIAALGGAGRSAETQPLVRAMLVLDDTPPAPLKVTRPHNGTAMFDLTLALEPDGDGYLECDLELFERETAERLAKRFMILLEDALADPDRPIAALALSTDEEQRLLLAWNDTRASHPPRRVHDWFVEQAAKTPDAPAVISGCATFSYRDIDRRSNQLARWLRAKGAARVGLSIDESADKAIAVLGVLKAGACCVPLDPSYPAERLEMMRRDADLTLVLGRDPLPAADGDGALDGGAVPEDPVYILYTSGSTGRPKGVALPHRALDNLIAWHAGTLPPGQRTLQLSPLSFDASFHEMFAAWATGGALVMADSRARYDMRLLARIIDTHAVEKVILPVVILHQLADSFTDGTLTSLRDVLATGEQLRITPAVTRLFTRLSGCRLHNHYGPSETHVVTAHTLEGAPGGWPALPPIGKPIANTQIHIVDAAGNVAPIGAVGELLVGGASLAHGYFRRPEQTAARFVSHALGRLYRTGDLARWRSDGTLEFLGRADDQLKIRGFRVEPGEIEAILCEHPRVRHAAVVARDQKLLAYVVGDIGWRELRDYAARRLPDYMIPAAFTSIAELPRTPSGKVDTRALPPPAPPEDEAGFVPARTETEARIAEIWATQLERERVGALDNFFELGGHSLIATRVMARISKTFGLLLSPRELFDRPTVAALSQRIDELQAGH